MEVFALCVGKETLTLIYLIFGVGEGGGMEGLGVIF